MRTVRFHIDAQAEKAPDAVYLIAPETGLRLTYSQLQKNCQTLTSYLTSLGLTKGDKISIMMHNGYQTSQLFLEIMYAGFVASPINLLLQGSLLLEELYAFCRQELGNFKTPKIIRIVEELPKGPSGKVQHLKLLDMIGSPTQPTSRIGTEDSAS